MLNITVETIKYCESLGLESWSTGGGCDYVGFYDPETKVTFQIAAKGDDRAGELNSPAELFVYDGVDFHAYLLLEFPSITDALNASASADFRSISLNLFATEIRPLSPERADRLVDSLLLSGSPQPALTIPSYMVDSFKVLNRVFRATEGFGLDK